MLRPENFILNWNIFALSKFFYIFHRITKICYQCDYFYAITLAGILGRYVAKKFARADADLKLLTSICNLLPTLLEISFVYGNYN